MGQHDCLLFGIEFVFQGLSHRVTIPDIWKFEKGISNASVAPRKFCYNFILWEQQNNFLPKILGAAAAAAATASMRVWEV